MSMTDPIADMLTRIRNAHIARHERVDIPASRLKEDIARILFEEGYVRKYRLIEDQKQNKIRLDLKYTRDKNSVISGLKRISKPGRRVYTGKSELPRVRNGLGLAIISTSEGILTAAQCKQKGIGGEVLCYVW
ncbi:30S ribosomal protein S8 [Candidatus Poribacteria bacterium]|nr:30S ribosomal protein S8 [Candidatus Poribacteria bacterium]